MYSHYLSRDDFKKFKEMQKGVYSGIGMELIEDPNGGLICLPYPLSPASMAGIQEGDRLMAVDRIMVR